MRLKSIHYQCNVVNWSVLDHLRSTCLLNHDNDVVFCCKALVLVVPQCLYSLVLPAAGGILQAVCVRERWIIS